MVKFYMCVVAVVIKYKDKECFAYPYLDQKSSHIFCDCESIDPSSNRIHNQQNFSANVERRDHRSNKRAIQMVLFDLNRHSTFTLPKVFSVVSIPVKPNFLPKVLHYRCLIFKAYDLMNFAVQKSLF